LHTVISDWNLVIGWLLFNTAVFNLEVAAPRGNIFERATRSNFMYTALLHLLYSSLDGGRWVKFLSGFPHIFKHHFLYFFHTFSILN